MKIGEFDACTVSDGDFWMDGGAMFGVVPKPLWQRLMPPDERNRIRLATNCLLVRRGGDIVLVEAGLGRRFAKKHREIYGITDDVTLDTSLRAAGVEPEAVTHVVLTHLHFDHCGAATVRTDAGIVPAFPNARHIVQRREWEEALHPSAATDTSYDQSLLLPLDEAGLVDLVDGDVEIVPGIRTEIVSGHTPTHQVVHIESGGDVLVFVSDLMPTSYHVRTHYNAAYDMHTAENLLNKLAFLDRAAAGGWRLFFYHDPEVVVATVEKTANGRFAVTPLDGQ
ncbi:MAG: MBL fold metallo-hydrolase [Verrucomicrobia bacterium]|nr:MBL fold metallo-hydrolase [Verrucomicrobiota bacterium]